MHVRHHCKPPLSTAYLQSHKLVNKVCTTAVQLLEPMTGSLPVLDVFCRTSEDRRIFSDVAEKIEQPPFTLNYESSSQTAHFSGTQYLSALKSTKWGSVLLAAGILPSTQDVLRDPLKPLADGIVVVADRQSAGKGRGGNVWTSPSGCLMFSTAFMLKIAPQNAPFINYVASLGVLQGAEDALAPQLQGRSLGIQIKWPNDIYAGKLKVGGILLHTTIKGGELRVVLGVGLNVSNHEPTTCIDSIAQGLLGPEAPYFSPGRELVLACIMNRLEEYFKVFEEKGFRGLEPEYLAKWMHSGQQLWFEDTPANPTSSVPSATRVAITITGISSAGYLCGVDAEGNTYELTPDGNSLDMMAGLIRRKM